MTASCPSRDIVIAGCVNTIRMLQGNNRFGSPGSDDDGAFSVVLPHGGFLGALAFWRGQEEERCYIYCKVDDRRRDMASWCSGVSRTGACGWTRAGWRRYLASWWRQRQMGLTRSMQWSLLKMRRRKMMAANPRACALWDTQRGWYSQFARQAASWGHWIRWCALMLSRHILMLLARIFMLG